MPVTRSQTTQATNHHCRHYSHLRRQDKRTCIDCSSSDQTSPAAKKQRRTRKLTAAMAKYTPASDQMRDRFFQVGEIVEKVLVHLDPVDVAAVAQTCWAMHDLILPSNNPTLWRRLYDRMFDPIDSCRRLGFDWRKAIPLCNVHPVQSSHLSVRKLAKSRATSRRAAPAWIVQRDANSTAEIGAEDDCDVNYATLVQSRCRARGVLHSPHEEKKVCRSRS